MWMKQHWEESSRESGAGRPRWVFCKSKPPNVATSERGQPRGGGQINK
jgi:hypothetical protein